MTAEGPEPDLFDVEDDREALAAEPSPRRQAVFQAALVGGYLFVVFGILLPRVVDYREVVEAFRAVPPEWLVVVLLGGVMVWVAEALAIRALLPALSLRRALTAYLSMSAVGSTIPGPFKFVAGFRMYRDWGIDAERATLALSLNGLASQASKLILPAVAVLFLTLAGTFPGPGLLVAILLSLPVAIGSLVGIWALRSEAFARRMGVYATRTTGAVMRRVKRPAPDDLTPRVLDFRASAGVVLRARALPTILSQLLARTMGYVLLVLSLRAVGVDERTLPADVILGVYAIVMVVTLLPIAPGGAGLPELLYISMFTRIVANPAMDDPIAAGVMLFRGLTWFLPIPVGYVLLLVHRRRYGSRAEAEADAGVAASPAQVAPAADHGRAAGEHA